MIHQAHVLRQWPRIICVHQQNCLSVNASCTAAFYDRIAPEDRDSDTGTLWGNRLTEKRLPLRESDPIDSKPRQPSNSGRPAPDAINFLRNRRLVVTVEIWIPVGPSRPEMHLFLVVERLQHLHQVRPQVLYGVGFLNGTDMELTQG